jgi:hypothetical protein
MWWWLVMDMAGEMVSAREVVDSDGEAVLEIGGVRGVVYCTGAA